MQNSQEQEPSSIQLARWLRLENLHIMPLIAWIAFTPSQLVQVRPPLHADSRAESTRLGFSVHVEPCWHTAARKLALNEFCCSAGGVSFRRKSRSRDGVLASLSKVGQCCMRCSVGYSRCQARCQTLVCECQALWTQPAPDAPAGFGVQVNYCLRGIPRVAVCSI